MRRVARILVSAAALPLAMSAAVVWPGSAASTGVAADAAPSVPAHYRVINLGGLSPNAMGDATAVNDRTEVVGFSTTSSGATHPFIWRHGVMTDLGVLEPGPIEYAAAADSGAHPGRSSTPTERGLGSGGMGLGTGSLHDLNNLAQLAGGYYFTYGLPGPALFV